MSFGSFYHLSLDEEASLFTVIGARPRCAHKQGEYVSSVEIGCFKKCSDGERYAKVRTVLLSMGKQLVQ